MFICYCIAVADFGEILKCKSYDDYDYHYGYYGCGYYSKSERHNAAVGAGFGSCMLIFTVVEFFVALASSIYCCNAVCCGAPTVSSVSNKALILTRLIFKNYFNLNVGQFQDDVIQLQLPEILLLISCFVMQISKDCYLIIPHFGFEPRNSSLGSISDALSGSELLPREEAAGCVDGGLRL